MWSAAEFLEVFFHSLGLGLELGQVRLKFGDHLGLAPEAAPEPTARAFTTAPAVSAVAVTGVLSAARAAAAATPGTATLAAGLAVALVIAMTVAALAMMLMSFTCLTVAHG